MGVRDGKLEVFPSEGGWGSSRDMASELVIDDEYSDCLDGVEEFSHVLVMYWSHLAEDDGRTVTTVHPAGRKDMPVVGVFATRSPVRPNPVCVTTVEVLGRNGNVLTVKGLDAVDGSPVIDIKPHLPHYDAPGEVRLAGGMKSLIKKMARDHGDERDR